MLMKLIIQHYCFSCEVLFCISKVNDDSRQNIYDNTKGGVLPLENHSSKHGREKRGGERRWGERLEQGKSGEREEGKRRETVEEHEKEQQVFPPPASSNQAASTPL